MRLAWILIVALKLLSAASAFIAPHGGGIVNTPHGTQVRSPSLVALRGAVVRHVVRGGDSVRQLSVAGRVPWKKLLISKAQIGRIVSIMRTETNVVDVIAMVLFSAFSMRI